MREIGRRISLIARGNVTHELRTGGIPIGVNARV